MTGHHLLLLVIWLAIASIYLFEMQLMLPLLGQIASPAGRQVWGSGPLAFTLLTALLTPLWPAALAACAIATVIHLTSHLRWSRAVRHQLALAPHELTQRVADLCIRWQTPPPAAILLDRSSQLGPCVVGLWRQTLILPDSQWESDQLAAILAHEMAHVARRHPLKFWLIGVATTLVGWHPLSRPLLNQLPLEMELEADRQAAAWLGDRRSYALLLGQLGLHQAAPQKRSFGVALAGRPADLIYRLQALIEPSNPNPHLVLPVWISSRAATRKPLDWSRRRAFGPLLPYLLSGGYLAIFLLLRSLV